MSELQLCARKKAFFGTCLFWIILAVGLFLIPRAPSTPVYNTIRIQLTSVEKKAPDSTVAEPTVSPVKKQKGVRTAPVVQEQPVSQHVAKSIEDLIAENNVPKKKQAVWDDRAFDSADSVVQTSAAPPVSPRPVPGEKKVSVMEGAAAAVSTVPGGEPVTVASGKSGGPGLSHQETRSALGTIEGTVAAAPSGSSVSSPAGSSSVGSITIKSGSARSLRRPVKPGITLSSAAAAKIDSDKKVTVSFTVLSNGTVPATDISVEPKSILPAEVYREIVEQIAQWLFEEAPDQGTASFSYVIKKN
jgi:hypothetical protein